MHRYLLNKQKSRNSRLLKYDKQKTGIPSEGPSLEMSVFCSYYFNSQLPLDSHLFNKYLCI